MNTSRIFIIAAGLLSILLSSVSCGRRQEKAPELRRITVQWGWIPDGHHAGFYVAREKGFYNARGLEAVFLPGGSAGSNPINSVMAKSADIGQAGGVEQVIGARARGRPVLAFAAIHRDTPHALISLASNPVRSAKDLPGKRVAVAFGDAAELLFKAYLAKAGVDPRTIGMEPFQFDLASLTNGRVDAITGFKTDQPVTLQEQGLGSIVLSYSSLGVTSYGYTLFTTEEFRARHPDIVEAFYAASREGFDYAFTHPDEAIAIMRKALGANFNESSEKAKLLLASTLMLDSSGQLADWSLEAEMVERAEGYLKDHGQLKEPVAPESVFKNIAK